MKKGKAAGIGITVIVAAIVFGIASLPDEVLLETPIAASENIPTETLPTQFQPEIISSEEQTVESEPEQAEPEQAEPEQAEPEQAEPEQAEPEQESEGKVIKVIIHDGVGAKQR